MSPNSKRTDRSAAAKTSRHGKSGKPKPRRPRHSDRNTADNGSSRTLPNDALFDPEADGLATTRASDAYANATWSAATTVVGDSSRHFRPTFTARDLVQQGLADLRNPLTAGGSQMMSGAPPDIYGGYGTVYQAGPSVYVPQSLTDDSQNEDGVQEIPEEELYRADEDDLYRANQADLYREVGERAGYSGSSGQVYSQQQHYKDLLEVDALFSNLGRRLPDTQQ